MTKILIDEALVRRALEALETAPLDHNSIKSRFFERRHNAITALRQALADAALDKMAENAREMGLDYMEGSAEQYEKELEQPAPAQEPVALDPQDVKIETLCKQRGGGFLSVMKSGVRLTHVPTGMTVSVTTHRGVHQNKADAWEILTQLVATPPAPAQEPDPDELTIAYMSGVYEGKKAERKRIVNLLMIQREAANGAHNYWKVAANLIQAEVASDT